MKEDKKVHGKCLHCGVIFEYVLRKNVLEAHPHLISAYQLYCSPFCENEERRELEALRVEREKQNPTFKQKFCPQCNYVPKYWKHRDLENCPYCKIPFEFREVIRWREKKREFVREEARKKRLENASVQTTD